MSRKSSARRKVDTKRIVGIQETQGRATQLEHVPDVKLFNKLWVEFETSDLYDRALGWFEHEKMDERHYIIQSAFELGVLAGFEARHNQDQNS